MTKLLESAKAVIERTERAVIERLGLRWPE